MNYILLLGALFRFRYYRLGQLSCVLALFRNFYRKPKVARLAIALGGNASVISSSPLRLAIFSQTMIQTMAPTAMASGSHVGKWEPPDKAGCSKPTIVESQYIV